MDLLSICYTLFYAAFMCALILSIQAVDRYQSEYYPILPEIVRSLQASITKSISFITKHPMKVFVKVLCLEEGDITLKLDVMPAETILMIKRKICEQIGIPASDQSLMFRAGYLRDDKTLLQYKIQSEATMECRLKMMMAPSQPLSLIIAINDYDFNPWRGTSIYPYIGYDFAPELENKPSKTIKQLKIEIARYLGEPEEEFCATHSLYPRGFDIPLADSFIFYGNQRVTLNLKTRSKQWYIRPEIRTKVNLLVFGFADNYNVPICLLQIIKRYAYIWAETSLFSSDVSDAVFVTHHDESRIRPCGPPPPPELFPRPPFPKCLLVRW